MKLIEKFFSMKVATIMMFLFAVIIGTTTFVENDYGTMTAQALVYKAKWFELFLFYFVAILVYQIIRFKSYKTKLPVFLFHLSFLIIAIGALTTRYFGYEGKLSVREDAQTNILLSADRYVQFQAEEKNTSVYKDYPIFLSSMTTNSFEKTIDVDGKIVTLSLEKYLPAFKDEVKSVSSGGKNILEFMVSGGGEAGRSLFIAQGETKAVGGLQLSYDSTDSNATGNINIQDSKDGLKVYFPTGVSTLSMDTKESGFLKSGINTLSKRTLYRFDENALVLKNVYKNSVVSKVASSLKPKPLKPEYMQMRVSVDGKSQDVDLYPIAGESGEIKSFDIGNMHISLLVGSKAIELPFYIYLKDFDMEKYPGSMTPSSYSSDVVLKDAKAGINMPYKIYMNHVLDYKNFRLFQTSYDPDEKGTILSVNHDPGTKITYLGYFLLALGLIWSLFTKNGRFQKLLKEANKLQALFILSALLLSFASLRADTNMTLPTISKEHSDKFRHLVVQDNLGRMKPIDTMATEVVSKVTGTTSMFGKTASELFLDMIIRPDVFQDLPIIKISHPQIAKDLGLKAEVKFAKFTDFFTPAGQYKLFGKVDEANQKAPLEKDQYDKELIKVDERVNVLYMTFTGDFLKIFPKPNDPSKSWYSPKNAINTFAPKDAQMIQLLTSNYFSQIDEALKSANWSKADEALGMIKEYQEIVGKNVMPSQNKIDFEVFYNDFGLFAKLIPYYLLIGVLLISFAVVNLIKPIKRFDLVTKSAVVLLSFGFIVHIIGLGVRWYITDHAPWSDAYESIIFIALTTVLAGLIVARRSIFALSATALLAGATMGVAHMNFINPEITPLVPVLKSYWLMIHVALIVSGDGFFGLGFILSLIAVIMYIFRSPSRANIDKSIVELSLLAEMSLLIGLVVFTIGNFLGGVWANESWGRYWGWDPKETWAAVTILIYALVAHLRFIPKLKSHYVFNIANMWAYSSVLMTYFGVNYYLSGLHSYAAGDPMPIPVWVYWATGFAIALSAVAFTKRDMKENLVIKQVKVEKTKRQKDNAKK